MSQLEKRPFVFINMAMTADGKIATANRSVSSFGSRRDVEHLYELRATADAVMAGARTIDLNPVHLGPGGRRFEQRRVKAGLSRYNLRIIVSGSGSINPEAAIFQRRFAPIIIFTSNRISARRLKTLRSLADDVVSVGRDEVDLQRALRHLHQRWQVRRLLCEGGAALNDALFRAGLVDEVHLTLCPKVFGGRTAPTISDGHGFPTLARAAQLELIKNKPTGNELFLQYRVIPH